MSCSSAFGRLTYQQSQPSLATASSMPFRSVSRIPFLLPFGAVVALWVPPAEAIVTPTPDPGHLSEAALQSALKEVLGSAPAFPYWNYLGSVNQSTGIYIGSGQILTAAHVGIGTFTTRDGRSYRPVAGSETRFRNRQGGNSDLFVYRIEMGKTDPLAALAPMTLSKTCPDRGALVVLLGAGGGNSGRKGPGPVDFRWNEDFRLRWGLNAVAAKFAGRSSPTTSRRLASRLTSPMDTRKLKPALEILAAVCSLQS